MGQHKISKLLNSSTISKFLTRKLIEVNDLSSRPYRINKNIRNPMLRSNLCVYRGACIVATETIIVAGTNVSNKINKMPNFKNNTPVRSCISKTNNTFIDNAEDLDIVILM